MLGIGIIQLTSYAPFYCSMQPVQDSQKDQSSFQACRHRCSRLMLSVVQEAMYVPVCNSVSAHMLGCAVKCVMKCWRSMQLGVRIVELFASMKTKVPIKLHIVSSRSRAQGSEVVATRMILYKLASMTLWWTMEFHQTEFNLYNAPRILHIGQWIVLCTLRLAKSMYYSALCSLLPAPILCFTPQVDAVFNLQDSSQQSCPCLAALLLLDFVRWSFEVRRTINKDDRPSYLQILLSVDIQNRSRAIMVIN